MLVFDDNNGTVGIDSNGFLEKGELDFEISYIKPENYRDVLEVNHYLNNLYSEIKVSSKDYIGLFITESFAKIHRDYQTVIILVTRGLMSQAKAVIRTMLEKLFVMAAVSKNPDNYDDWIGTQNAERNRLLRAIKRGDIQPVDTDPSKLTENEFAKKVSFSEWADRADMKWDYNVIYRLFSRNVHCTETGYVDDLEIDNEGEVVAIKIYPDYEEADQTLILAKRYALISATIIKSYLCICESGDSFQEYQSFLDDAQKNIKEVANEVVC